MEIRQALARGYCSERNKHKILDLNLIEDMATEVEKLFQDAEMPQPITIQEKRIAEPLCEISFNKGRIVGHNQHHLKWLAYHLRKMNERVDVERLSIIIQSFIRGFIRGADVSVTDKISSWNFRADLLRRLEDDAKYPIHKTLATAIAKEIGGKK